MKRYFLFIIMSTLLLSCSNLSNETSNTSSFDLSSNDSTGETTTSSETSQPLADIDDFNTTPKASEYEQIGYKTLYQDLNFKNGFKVSKAFYGSNESPHYEEKINLYEKYEQEPPTWTIAQWSSNFDIMIDGYDLNQTNNGLVNEIVSNGKLVYGKEVPAKRVQVDSRDGSIYLESNCQVEYTQPRVSSDPWVHLLLEQSFGNNGNELVFIKDLQSLYVEANYTIEKFEDIMGESANPGVHAAQLVWFITIQNRNVNSSGYGRYIWFGIPLWDNRSVGKQTAVYSAHDKGTDTLIYSMASSDYLKYNGGVIPNVNEKAKAKVDILNIVTNAFNNAKDKGYLANTNFEDLAIGGTNFGFEMPGTYNIGVKIDDLGVYYLK